MKKNLFYILLTYAFLGSTSVIAQDQTYFAAYPSLTPDAQNIIFAYEGDLWTIPKVE